ncbi:hypothetical protein, partial [Mesorhizobium sp. B2-3-13]|uniref:hypothetical protein n=1 Tax=Mesorhizobium sp. B2-3-13 TaxID=2589951 RepID=UPI001AED3E4F
TIDHPNHPSSFLTHGITNPVPCKGLLAGEGRSATLRLAKLRSAAILAAKIISRTGKLVSRTARLK